MPIDLVEGSLTPSGFGVRQYDSGLWIMSPCCTTTLSAVPPSPYSWQCAGCFEIYPARADVYLNGTQFFLSDGVYFVSVGRVARWLSLWFEMPEEQIQVKIEF